MNVSHKKTKIVATIGPVTKSEEVLSKMLKAGFNVMRLNFSHGDFDEHQEKVDNLKKAIKTTGIPAAIMQDLAGPKIRIGNFKDGVITLVEGQLFTLTTDEIEGDETRVSVNYKPLPQEVKVGGSILLFDGKRKLNILEIKGNDVVCKVIVGGDIKSRRGINLPGAHLSISSLTDKDKNDLQFAFKNNVDFVAFSFVRRAQDIVELRDLLKKEKSDAKIIAKIEDTEGVENIDAIIELVDGVMVARGDMAIEINPENVPMVQKSIIKKCNEQGKIVITATHMLESMIKSPVPTRAEVSDIANAIIDGTDAIMLSEETTLGDFPIESVEVMTRVALNIENDELYMEQMLEKQTLKHTAGDTGDIRVADAITNEAVDIANTLDAKAIIAFTNSGFTARMISRYKPLQPIIALTPNEETARQLLMSYGVTPVLTEKITMLNDVMKIIRTYCLKHKLAEKGDKVVVAVGMPFGKKVDTNMLLVETI